MNKIFKKSLGFTLIELLVVIAILAILAVGVLVAIDPIDKINSGNDSKVQSDIGQIANAMEAYAVSHNGLYAADLDTLKTVGELKIIPTAPTGYAGYTVGAGGSSQTACGELKSKKYVNAVPSTPSWVWCSSTGKAGSTAGCSTCP